MGGQSVPNTPPSSQHSLCQSVFCTHCHWQPPPGIQTRSVAKTAHSAHNVFSITQPGLRFRQRVMARAGTNAPLPRAAWTAVPRYGLIGVYSEHSAVNDGMFISLPCFV